MYTCVRKQKPSNIMNKRMQRIIRYNSIKVITKKNTVSTSER